ncbi:MAG TPA: oxygenase MpaB family protein [Methylomirabilota bacterium]|nr:oxygenase MpaB family protein [Methylomirabilota bacterium]
MADDRWSDALLDGMRREGDPLADATVKAVFDAGAVAAVNRLLTTLVRNDGVPTDGLPAEVKGYLEASALLPGWADPARIRIGEGLFLRYGLTSFGILACASLPECYVLRDVAAVLGTTQRLDTHARRRIFETAMMVLGVMDEGGLAPGGGGIRIVQKVRLMHAAVRRLILATPAAAPATGTPATLGDALLAQRWPAERGLPLSQEDLGAVLLTFSHVMLRSWRHLGITITPEEAEAYLHCWNVVGHVLGIREELMAHDVADAERLFEAIKRKRAADTPDGRALTTAVLGVTESFAGPSRILLQPIPRILMHGLLAPPTCTMLGVAALGVWATTYQPFLRLVARTTNMSASDVFRDLPVTAQLSALISQRLLDELVRLPRGGQRTAFHMPEKLAKRWGVTPR